MSSDSKTLCSRSPRSAPRRGELCCVARRQPGHGDAGDPSRKRTASAEQRPGRMLRAPAPAAPRWCSGEELAEPGSRPRGRLRRTEKFGGLLLGSPGKETGDVLSPVRLFPLLLPPGRPSCMGDALGCREEKPGGRRQRGPCSRGAECWRGAGRLFWVRWQPGLAWMQDLPLTVRTCRVKDAKMLWCCVGSVGSEGRASSRLCLFLWHAWGRGLGAALAARGPRGVAGVGCVRPSWVCRGNGLSAPLAACRQLKSPLGSRGAAAPFLWPCSLPAPRGRGAGCCETPRAERHPVNH